MNQDNLKSSKILKSKKNMLLKVLDKLVNYKAEKIDGPFCVIHFGQDEIKVGCFEHKNNGFKILSFEKSCIPTALADQLIHAKEFLSTYFKANPNQGKDVIISTFGIDAVYVKYLELPLLKKNEILKASKWQLAEDASIDIDQAIIDWQIVREDITQEEKKQAIVFYMINRDMVERYLSIVEQLDLNPRGLTVGAYHYTKYFDSLENVPSTTAILDIGEKNATISFFVDKQMYFIRGLPVSAEKLIQSLTGAVGSEQGKIELSFKQAKDILKTVGIPKDEAVKIKGNITGKHINLMIRPFMEILVRELKFSMDYFTEKFPAQTPSLIYITGEGADINRLDKVLGQRMPGDVAILNLPDDLDTSLLKKGSLNKYKNDIPLLYAVAMGGLRGINLLPPEKRASNRERIQVLGLRLLMLVLAVIFFIGIYTAVSQIQMYKKNIRKSLGSMSSLEDIQEVRAKLRLKEDVIAVILKQKVPVDGVLKMVSHIVPEEIILNELIVDQNNNTLKLKGDVEASQDNNQTVLINFMKTLEQSSFIIEASLVSSQKRGYVEKFEIECTLIQ